MDVRKFVKKQEAALKRYRRVYKLLDFLVIALILYLLLFYFKVDQVFPLMSNFEVKAGTFYNILGIDIAFENLALILIAVFISIIVTFIFHLRDDRTKALFLIEQKHPDLRERLRTAYDNLSEENLIVSDLVTSVSSRISHIPSSELLIKRRMIIGIIFILISTTAITYVANNDIRTDLVDPEDIKEIIDNLPFTPVQEDTSGDLFEIEDENTDDEGSSGNENLTGDTAVIVVDGKEVDLTLPPGSGVGFGQGEESEEADEEFERSSPYEISVISSQAYNEELPEGYESVIRSYFEEMADT